jgi:RHS repeat-associated protein
MFWDFEDQLQMVDKGGDVIAYYVYDASGERVRKVIEQNGEKKKERIYLGGFEVYREYNVNSTLTLERETLHIMDDKQRIALVETCTLDTAGNDPAPRQLIRYQFGNHLGSASLELDTGGHVISYEEYYPYGSTSYQGVRKEIEVPLKRYRYTGKERDEETGLYYHGARYYVPWLGRWVSCDTAELNSCETRYGYVDCRPISMSDPTGKQMLPFMNEMWNSTINKSIEAAEQVGTELGKEVLQGDFYKGESTITGIGLNILIGLTPFFGQVPDLRDTMAAGFNLMETPSSQTLIGVALAVAAWVPGGDLFKKPGKHIASELFDATLKAGRKEIIPLSLKAAKIGTPEFTKLSQKAYFGTLGDTMELKQLWDKAVSKAKEVVGSRGGKKFNELDKRQQFNKVREKFWEIINKKDDEDAVLVANMLEEAKYALMEGNRAPVLKLTETARIGERRLSLDHDIPIDRDIDNIDVLDPSNIGFMSHSENARKTNRR